jgi:hypothetical protein
MQRCRLDVVKLETSESRRVVMLCTVRPGRRGSSHSLVVCSGRSRGRALRDCGCASRVSLLAGHYGSAVGGELESCWFVGLWLFVAA